jgi:hypothetical protein
MQRSFFWEVKELIGFSAWQKTEELCNEIRVIDGCASDFVFGRKILKPKLEKAEIENMRNGL